MFSPLTDAIYPMRKQISPAVSLSSSALDDGLHEDAQFLQACVSAYAHPDDADAQAVVIWAQIEHRVTECHGEVTSLRSCYNGSNPKWLFLILMLCALRDSWTKWMDECTQTEEQAGLLM